MASLSALQRLPVSALQSATAALGTGRDWPLIAGLVEVQHDR